MKKNVLLSDEDIKECIYPYEEREIGFWKMAEMLNEKANKALSIMNAREDIREINEEICFTCDKYSDCKDCVEPNSRICIMYNKQIVK